MAIFLGLGARSATKHAVREENVRHGAGRALCSSRLSVDVQYEPKPNGFGDTHRPVVATAENVVCKRCLFLLTYHGLIEESVVYVPQPGDFCRFVGHNPVTHIEHHAPCPDGHPTGTLTDARTGKVVSEPPPSGFAAPYAQRNQP